MTIPVRGDGRLWPGDNVTPEEDATLQQCAIHASDDLWYNVGRDFDTGIEKLARETKLPPHRVAHVLTVLAAREADQSDRGAFVFHWFEGLAVAFALGVVIVAFEPLTSPAVVVSRTAGLRPFHVVEPDDVVVHERERGLKAVVSKDHVVGRYTLEHLPPGAAVRADHVSERPIAPERLRGRTVVSLDIELAKPAPGAGEVASLLFVRENHAEPRSLIVNDAIVLAVTGQHVALAVRDQAMPELAAMLANSKAFVLHRLAPPEPGQNSSPRPP